MSYRAYTPPSQAQPDPSSSPLPPPPPPAHRSPVGMHPESNYTQMQNQRQYQDPNGNSQSNYLSPEVTPGADNLGEAAAGGGINGIALGVAHSHEREGGVQAQNTPFSDQYAYESPSLPRLGHPQQSYGGYGSNAPLAPGGASPAGMWSSNSSQHSMPLSSVHQNAYPYSDSPYSRYSSSNLNLATHMGEINPNDVADDDDWGMEPVQQKRRSFARFGAGSGSRDGTPGPAAAGGAAAAGAAAAVGGAVAVAAATTTTTTGGGSTAAQDASGQYNAVPNNDGSQPEIVQEKSEWLKQQNHGRKRLMWIVATIIAILVIGAIVGGVLGSLLTRKNNPSGSSSSGSSSGGGSGQNAAQDDKNTLTKNSPEIQKLMNNKNLHKVFPGMDYTPLNGQYPDCLTVPPSQNNITRDIAVMSQLTNAVRLYGTDCNQTDMVLEAIDRLELSDMKVWLGVWLGNNGTTNDRQIAQMWDVLEKRGSSKFKGVIVGNEVLFRKDLTVTELIGNITDIKSKLDQYKLPIATSDLGDNWTADMADKVDIVMSNVHPFFAGVEASGAAGWTWDFWTSHDVILTKNNASIKQIIAEVGWPSGGGNDCGDSTCTSSTQGSIAGVDEMNQFMQDWVCPSMANSTEYFWFSAFDEPWKIIYNTPGKEWEDKWGLMDVNRNLKNGVTIPDCGGQTVSS